LQQHAPVDPAGAPAESFSRWDIAVPLTFALVSLIGILHHEMWRDELEIWLLARDSSGWHDLLRNISTQEHPALWYIAAYGLARFSSNPLLLQLFHWCIAIGAVVVFYRWAPWNRVSRVLFCFGYYAAYEFGLISRSYAPQLLLMFLFCAMWPQRRKQPLALALILAVLANTNIYGVVTAGCFLLFAVLQERRGSISAALLAAAGILLGLGQIATNTLRLSDAHLGAYRPDFDWVWLAEGLATIQRSFLPLPQPGSAGFWNTNLLDALPTPFGAAVGALLGVILAAYAIGTLRRSPHLAAVFALGFTAMLCITLFIWFGQQRHHGQLFVFYVACLWLAHHVVPRRDPAERRWVLALCVVQLVAAGWAYQADLRQPFSHGRAVAGWISRHVDADVPVVASFDYSSQSIAAYSTREFYHPETERFGTFVGWGGERRMRSFDETLAAAAAMARSSGEVLLVLSYDPGILEPGQTRTVSSGLEIDYVQRFVGAIVPDENFHLYRVRRVADGSS